MKKRLLFIPLHYNITPRPHEDWFNALSREFDCEYMNINVGLGFDYIFIQSGALKPLILSQIKLVHGNASAKVIQWTGDARDEVMENVIQYKGIVDLTLLAVGIGQKEMYEKALGSRVDYLQQGVFEKFFIEPKELTEGKIVFIGNNYDHFEGAIERTELCEILAKEFPQFETIGNGFDSRHNNTRSIPYEESAKIYNESYISISHACFNEIEGYYSNRTLDIMASGGFCLMRRIPNCNSLISRHATTCLFYDSNEECVELIYLLIRETGARNGIANAGHEYAKKYHTFRYRAKQIKELCDSL